MRSSNFSFFFFNLFYLAKSYLPPGYKWVSDCTESQSVINSHIYGVKNEKVGSLGPKAIIIEPSKELAEQTYRCIQSFKKYLPNDVKLLLVFGGVNAKDQVNQLKSGVDIVIATPGRLEDLIFNNMINIKQCRYVLHLLKKTHKLLLFILHFRFLILDEVDGLLQQGHLDLINRLHSRIPRMFDDGKRLQMIVCSATLHNFDVQKLAEKLMYFPIWIDIKVSF